MIGRFFMTYAMNTGTQISYEVVPTVLRGQGNALANVFSLSSAFFSPYIVYSVRFYSHKSEILFFFANIFSEK